MYILWKFVQRYENLPILQNKKNFIFIKNQQAFSLSSSWKNYHEPFFFGVLLRNLCFFP